MMIKQVAALMLIIGMGMCLNITQTVITGNATQNITVSGLVKLDNGTATNAMMIIDMQELGMQFVSADSNGVYSLMKQVPLNARSKNYTITTTAITPEASNITNYAVVYGRTDGMIIASPNYFMVLNITAVSGKNITLSTSLQYSTGNAPNNYTINASIFNRTYSMNGSASSFDIEVPSGTTPGSYLINLSSVWKNDDSTSGSALSSVPVYIEATQGMTVNSSLTNISVDVTKSFNITLNVTSTGNTIVSPVYMISGVNKNWYSVINDGPISPNSTRAVTLNFTVPYETAGGVYSGNIIITSPTSVINIPLTVNVSEPVIAISPIEPEYVIESNPNMTLSLTIGNNGKTDANNITLSVICPLGWTCSTSPKTVDKLLPGKTALFQANIQVISPESVADKTVRIKAVDAGGRVSEITTKIIISADSTKLITAPMLIYNLIDPDFNEQSWYFMNGDSMVLTTDFNTTNISGRAVRDSTLATWIVKLGNSSKGIGDVCDISLIVHGIKYDVNNVTSRTIGQALTGEVGETVYEVFHFNKLGECVADFDYGSGKETITHIVASGQPPEQTIIYTKDEVTSLINAADAKRAEDNKNYQMILALLVLGGGVVAVALALTRDTWKGFVFKDKSIKKDVIKLKEEIRGEENGFESEREVYPGNKTEKPFYR